MLTLDRMQVMRDGFRLSADVTFSGAITALLGPSGAGKSTVLDLIAGFVMPGSGEVLWDGDTITHLPPPARPCAVVFQDNNLFPHLSVAGNLSLACRGGVDAGQRISAILREVGMEGYEARKPGVLSGGQQARVALARALLQARPLLLLDEAFAALGPALKAEMLDLVTQRAHAHDLRVVMVSHDPQDAARIADETAVVADGTVFAPQPTLSLLRDPPPALRAYLGIGGPKENPPAA